MSAFAVHQEDDDDHTWYEADECENLELTFEDLDDDDDDAMSSVGGSQAPDSWNHHKMDDTLFADEEETVIYTSYILGTMIIRVVAARGLQPVVKGGALGHLFFRGGIRTSSKGNASSGRHLNTKSANPYAKLVFGGQTQRTPVVYDTIDPVWPRGDSLCFDVSLPVPDLAATSTTAQLESSSNDQKVVENVDEYLKRYPEKPEKKDPEVKKQSPAEVALKPLPTPPRPILSIVLLHSIGQKSGKKKKNYDAGAWDGTFNNDEPILGMGSIDLTPLLTGKMTSIDRWLPLSGELDVGGSDRSNGAVRVICEYDSTDPPPRQGDLVRFTGFCNPVDLYPIPVGRTFLVEEVNPDDPDSIILSYTTPEGWKARFAAHRYMLICAVRHRRALEKYHDEISAVAKRFAHSPLVKGVVQTVDRVPEDGLIFVGADAVKEGVSLLGRWFQGGVGKAVGDIVDATNWDDRHTPADENSDSDDDDSSSEENESRVDDGSEQTDDESKIALPGMPCCPITGEPMKDPVVAADGHTYERSAIRRWLQRSNKSPLTGGVLPHKELVPNYVLMSSLRDGTTSTTTL